MVDLSAGTLLAFAALTAVIVTIPGPAVILILKSAVLRGRGPAVVAGLGVLTADLIWAAASVAGLTALLVSSQLAFDLVRLAGAAYLIYLGLRLVIRPELPHTVPATSTNPATSTDPAPAPAPSASARRAFLEGFGCDLSNPKTVIVYASVIPQFLGANGTATDILVLGVLFALLGFLSCLVYALAFGSARHLLARGRRMRVLLRGSGVVLVGFGGGLVLDR